MNDVISLGANDMRKALADVEKALSLHEKKQSLLPMKVVMDWGEKKRINALPGFLGGDINMAGIKWIGSNPENPHKYGLPRASALIILNDPVTKIPIAVMDGTVISAVRTGAVSGVAAKYLSREDSKTLVIIGAGVQGKTQLDAIMTVRPDIKKVYIYDLDYDRSIKFINEVKDKYDTELIAAKAGEDALKNADILVTATVAMEPVIDEDWLKPGALYLHVGGYECTYAAVDSCDKIVVDDWIKVKSRMSSTVSLMANDGIFTDDRIYAELGEIINGKKPGRTSINGKIYFNGTGLAIEDIAVANRIYNESNKKGIGIELVLWDNPSF